MTRKYRVEVILERTYGTTVIEADSEEMANDIARNLEASDFDTAVNNEIDVLDVYEESES